MPWPSSPGCSPSEGGGGHGEAGRAEARLVGGPLERPHRGPLHNGRGDDRARDEANLGMENLFEEGVRHNLTGRKAWVVNGGEGYLLQLGDARVVESDC